MKKNERDLYKSYKVLKELVSTGHSDISKETAFVIGFDANCFTGIIKMDPILKTTEYRLYDYSYTISGDRIKIKKLSDGRI